MNVDASFSAFGLFFYARVIFMYIKMCVYCIMLVFVLFSSSRLFKMGIHIRCWGNLCVHMLEKKKKGKKKPLKNLRNTGHVALMVRERR